MPAGESDKRALRIQESEDDSVISSRKSQDSYLALGIVSAEGDTERERLANVIHWWEGQMDTAKWPRAIDWFRNYAFIAGNHYPNFRWNGESIDADVDGAGGTMPQAQLEQFIPKTSDNKMIRPYEQNKAVLTEHQPRPRITPTSDLPEDEDASELGVIVHDAYWETLRMQARMRHVSGLIQAQGTAAVEIIYEETDIPEIVQEMETAFEPDPILVDGEGSPVMNGRQRPTGKESVVFRKDLRAHTYSAFEMQPDPGATDEPDSETWYMRRSFVDLEWGRDTFNRDEPGYFPEDLDKVRQDTSINTPLYWWERVKDILDLPESWFGLSGYPYNATGGFAPMQTVMNVIDCKPNRYYPRGRTIITLGNRVVYSGDARVWSEQYKERWHPYSIFRWWNLTGRFWGIPLMSFLVPLQRRINAIDSLTQLNREFMTLGQWLVPTISGIPDGALSGFPGQEVRYKVSSTGAKPEKVSHEPLPSELPGERAQCVDAIDIIAGTERGLEGPSNSAVRAGVMLDAFHRKSMQSKSATIQGFNESTERVGTNILMETSLNVTEEDTALTQRIRAAARDHSTLAIEAFVGADLRDQVVVRYDIASRLLDSPEARKQMAMDFANLIGQKRELTAEESNTLAKVIGFDEWEKKDSPHVNRARRLVSRITQGMIEAAFPLAIDNPAIFAEVIQNEMLRDKYHNYSRETKEALTTLLQYYEGRLIEQEAAAKEDAIVTQFMLALASQGRPIPGMEMEGVGDPKPREGASLRAVPEPKGA